MEKNILRSLELLGLSALEVKFFLASLKLGPATIGQIAKYAKLERSTAYLIAENLKEKELLEVDLKSYRKKVFAVEPKQLLRIISARQRQFRRNEIDLEENLPSLQALYSTSNIRPQVRVFEGKEGLLTIWQDILSSKSEILLWTNQETEKLFFEKSDHEKFISQRITKGLNIKVLTANNASGRALLKMDMESLRETRILPKGKLFNSETYIYDNKVAILDYTTDIIGVIIENESISNTHRTLFDIAWSQAFKE